MKRKNLSPRRRAALLPLLLALAVPLHAKSARSATAEPPLAAGFDLPTPAGTVSLAALRSKVVLVDFWASWCIPCRQELPWLSTISERYSANGLVVVAINVDKERELADDFLRQLSPPFIIAFDPEGKTAEAFNVKAMPSSYIVSREGRLVYSHSGFDSRDAGAIEQQIKEEVSK